MKQQFASLAEIGFFWNTRVIRANGDIEEETTHNVMPYEALTDMLKVWLKGGTQSVNWYMSLFEGNYTPDLNVTAATYPGIATETTTYTATSRPPLVLGTVLNGAVDNGASRVIFTMTSPKTIYGGALLSASTKGGVTGVLGSIATFASPKALGNNDQLSVSAGINLVSA